MWQARWFLASTPAFSVLLLAFGAGCASSTTHGVNCIDPDTAGAGAGTSAALGAYRRGGVASPRDIRPIVRAMAQGMLNVAMLEAAEHQTRTDHPDPGQDPPSGGNPPPPEAASAPRIAVLRVLNRAGDHDLDALRFTYQLVNVLVTLAQDRVAVVYRSGLAPVRADRLATAGHVEEAHELSGVDYYVVTELRRLAESPRNGIKDRVYVSFRLVDAKTGKPVWSEDIEVAEASVRDFVNGGN